MWKEIISVLNYIKTIAFATEKERTLIIED